VVTGTGTAKDPRTSTRYHLRLLEKNVLEHMYRGDVGGELTPYRSPPSAVEAAPFFQPSSGLRRMLASDLVRALPNRCLRDIFFVRRSNVWPPSSRAGSRGPGGYNRYVESPGIMRRRVFPTFTPL
jgi:hypothetical protein